MSRMDEIIGQEGILEHMKRAIGEHAVSHAYLISGEEGAGKRMIAKAFAKALLCTGPGVEPCGKCQSCLQMESGNQPDVLYVTHEKAGIGVDDIREQVTHTIEIKPYAGAWKIYIIPEAEKMTEQAQNALLKTLEEPPEYAVLLLLASNTGPLLPTLLSRVVELPVAPVKEEKILELLEKNYQIPKEEGELAAVFSQGNVGKAIRFATSEYFIQDKEMVLQWMRKIGEAPISELMEMVRELAGRKQEVQDLMDFMKLWYRDVLYFKATKDANGLIYKTETRDLSRMASRMSYEGAKTCIDGLEKAGARLRANVNFDLTMELLLLTLKENGNG